MKRILFLSPWNTICGVSEFAHFLAYALQDRGHEIRVFANLFAGEYFPTGLPREDGDRGVGVDRRFQTGFCDPANGARPDWLARWVETVDEWKPDVVLLNFQDYLFPQKVTLNSALFAAVARGAKVFVLLHDDCISPDLIVPITAEYIVPPSLDMHGPRVHIIDQGIPRFPPTPDKGLPPITWQIGCFGLGRNKVDQLITAVEQLNHEGLSRPVALNVHIAKPNQIDEVRNSWVVIKHLGYLPPQELANTLGDYHACVIWYPPILGHSTSSAFRFAVAAQVPIICNQTNWVADMKGNSCWIKANDSVGGFTYALKFLLREKEYSVIREFLTTAQIELTKRIGWDVIAHQYECLF